jgi:hypothetical protein
MFPLLGEDARENNNTNDHNKSYERSTNDKRHSVITPGKHCNNFNEITEIKDK